MVKSAHSLPPSILHLEVLVQNNAIWLNSYKRCIPVQIGHHFNNVDFCTGLVDDAIKWGEEVDVSDHERYLTKFLLVTRQHNLKLNLDKLLFKKK